MIKNIVKDTLFLSQKAIPATKEDKYILFPQHQQNPKAPKFVLKKVDSEKREKVE